MHLSYTLTPDELSIELLESIKMLFKNKKININISEAVDETEYLNSSPLNAKRLESSINQIQKKENLIYKSLEDLGIQK